MHPSKPRTVDALSFFHPSVGSFCVWSDYNIVGDTVDEAVSLFVTLDRQCHVQLLTEAASANGLQRTLIEDSDAEYSARFIQDPHATYLQVRSCRSLISIF
jgi:hypothetical protein